MTGYSLFHMSCPSCLHTRVDEVNGAEFKYIKVSVPIDVVTMTEVVDRVLSLVGQPNLHMVAMAMNDYDGTG